MFRSRRRSRVARVAVAGAAALLAVGLAACSDSSSPAGGSGPSASASGYSTATAVPSGTARVALPAGATLSYIWPYTPRASASQYNAGDFQRLMYRPLYMFGGNGPSVTVNYPLSVASAPVYADGGKTVTITMKGWRWSDGEAVDASDVVFWLNLMKAEPAGFHGYVPGLLPDNVTSYRAAGPDTVVLNLKSAVSSVWFTYNQLAEITPMPAAWDVTSAGAKPGSGGCVTDTARDKWAKCTAVYDFLSAQAENAKTYATSPLWGVVDGPWKLSAFAAASPVSPVSPVSPASAASGAVASFVWNPAYSGSPKPQLAGFTYYAYTGEPAEYGALKAGKLDVGYVPDQDLAPLTGGQVLPPASPLGTSYTLAPDYTDGIEYFELNFNNPALGPAFKQLYVRQALQELIDQEGMVDALQRGYGYPTSGGVPSEPANPWAPAIQNSNGGQGPYPFSVASATSLLTSHGWRNVGGVMTCESATACGSGVAQGTRLSITLDYAAGDSYFQQMASVIKPDMGEAGIRLNLVPQSSDTVRGEAAACQPAQARCPWQALYLGGSNFNGPGFEPTGELLFGTGAQLNAGGYSDPGEDKLINLTHASDSLPVFQQYATYTAEQLPFIWLPNAYRVTATTSKLANVGNNPLATLLPEYWYFTS
jgi:peptide/nickel transport system substrate-binding protein